MFPLLVLSGRLPGRSKERISSCGTGEPSRRVKPTDEQVSDGDGVPDNVLWVQQSATTTWTEVNLKFLTVLCYIFFDTLGPCVCACLFCTGPLSLIIILKLFQGQVEIRGARQGEEYVGWQMFLRGQKPADITAFIAVDDFR